MHTIWPELIFFFIHGFGWVAGAVVGALPTTADLVSHLKGPAGSEERVNGPVTFVGSRHESDQLPQPYSMVNVRSYLPSALVMRILGAGRVLPATVISRKSPLCDWICW